ncbi:DUF21 domain-containing protein At2g14520-like isoform X2 [Nicotiana tomentosiformis]|uniref:DUF21 domain-containing protein At2g14520-like isoform X2 n=1 Tax=Nicotiana tomentosiformis TaxID=4098 RepID=UPI00051B6D13|nr:DUF21 domain-containing protein At2g14520-like [Nicotiana tomentosiformis]
MGHTILKCCNTEFFLYILAVVFLVLCAGLMSGLTLGLMSMSIIDLEVLAKSGTPKDRRHASKILPIVKQQHLLLCTLLISNAAAMEALPVFLDVLVPDWGAILLSVTLILLFGEIIPQSLCTRYGLAIGATVAPIVRVLIWFWFPVAYPISKILDYLLGKGHKALFRRAELRTLVDMHGNKAGKGGELSLHETTIIAGALELTEKTARDAMTPISETFAIDVNANLDRDLVNLILEKGHSRVPVYYEHPTNIIGLVLVKNLVTINPRDNLSVKNVTIRRIPRVSATMPLYDILNEFQKGLSHMAAVVKKHDGTTEKEKESANLSNGVREVRLNIPGESFYQRKSSRARRSLRNSKRFSANISRREYSKSRRWSEEVHPAILTIKEKSLSAEEINVIGIITMEDVIEELLNEEIYDETDHLEANSLSRLAPFNIDK